MDCASRLLLSLHALKLTWQVGIAFGIGVLLVFLDEQVELRKDLKDDFGIEEKIKGSEDVFSNHGARSI